MQAALVNESVGLIPVFLTGAPAAQHTGAPHPRRSLAVTQPPRHPPHVDSAWRIKVCLLPGPRRCAECCADSLRLSGRRATPLRPCQPHPSPPPHAARGPRPPTLPHGVRRCTRPRPPAHARLPEGKAPPPSVGTATPPPPGPPGFHPIASVDGRVAAAVVRISWPMGKRTGPSRRGFQALSRSGPCENGGSECKAKFFCKPSAKAGGRRRRPRPGRVQLRWPPPLQLLKRRFRGANHRGGDQPGKTCAESPQMLGAFAARSCLSPAPAGSCPCPCRGSSSPGSGGPSFPPPPPLPPRCGCGGCWG